jgi:Sec-independent protein secretion pathway component TatC
MPIQPKRLPFFEHIAELRQRLLIIVVTLFVGSTILYFDPFFR